MSSRFPQIKQLVVVLFSQRSRQMHNGSCPPPFLQVLGPAAPSAPPYLACHGGHSTNGEAVMFLLHVFTFLSFLLTVLHLVSFLLTKLFTFLLERAAATEEQIRDSHLIYRDEIQPVDDDSYSGIGDFAAGIFSREDSLLFFYNQRVVNDTLLVEQEKGSNQQQNLLEVDESFVAESWYGSPLDHPEELGVDVPADDVTEPSDVAYPITYDGTDRDEDVHGDAYQNNKNEEEEEEEFSSKELRLEEDKESSGGSLTGTDFSSKSSTGWRNVALFRDSETECLFSSSSQRSSSHWETYTSFRRYDEERMLFDRFSAQKLTETESFRSIRFQPRSMSERLVHRLTTPKKEEGGRDPYQELEAAYVSQICLAWEALNWNYNNIRQRSATGDGERASCTVCVAQQFQQFQVLLQRFIENEPCERGRRPEVFARTRISAPKLLQVPEFREADEGKEDVVSSTEFLAILVDAIRTFLSFLQADKENPCQMLRAFIKRKSSSVNSTLLHVLRRANKKKKMRLKDIMKRRRCLERKRSNGDEETDVLMGLIDMKIVSRILRMPEISQEQLRWCEKELTRVRIWDGKVLRDSSPLPFPVH
ncbi:unnamed protein product [Musa acuminata subsp. malaccensis]|uniref:(wild Malaysian banana) hypothetical protein n=1 Tax=Musa acuminata subsp. malaccensis TaxID=214687 RepID=A0A804IEW4_MUSAM|nr:PREDICTED: uncharacterized protein LOC103979233 isoform X1 [Musa acuminata subsp. malaccensis]CAG1850921.1 unnamed protein product [Musa acuminata subsp. malaccensis]